MKKTLRAAAAAVFLIATGGIACAQTTLRIGLAEDPDILDPTLARTYVGRIVFASFCDKLFDIDEKLNVVPLTIKITLKAPFAPLIAQLTDRAGMMVAPKAATEAGDKFGLHPVCAGPYKFIERVPQGRIVGEKFADYWNKDNVHIDRVVYLPVSDETVRLANLKSGGLDLIERAPAPDIKDIRADPKLKLATALGLGYMGIDINIGKGERANNPLGKSVAVRRALDAAIDREALNQVVFNGEFVPGDQWVNPENYYYQQSFPVPKRDVAKAKALLKEAGVTTPFDVDFMVAKGAEPQSVAEVIQAMAAEIGINMKIRVTEFATSLKQAEAGEYEAYLLDWSGSSDPDGNLYSFYKCKAPLNYPGTCNPDIDKLLDESRIPSDRAQRKTIYEKLTQLILDNKPILYLYHRRMLIAHTARLEGYRQLPDGMVRVVGLTLK